MGVNQSKNDIEEMVAKFSKVKYSEVTDIDSFSDFETEKKKIQPKEQSHSLLKWKESSFYELVMDPCHKSNYDDSVLGSTGTIGQLFIGRIIEE